MRKIVAIAIISMVLLSEGILWGKNNPGSLEENEAIPEAKHRFQKKVYQVQENRAKIKIDGKIDEAAWNDALILHLDYEIFPGDNTKARAKTDCWLTYSKSHIFVAFRAYDPQLNKIRVHLSDHDDIWKDDQVGIVLDTFNDGNRAFGFFSNPLGIQQDFIYYDGGDSYDSSWDTIWDAKGRITAEGFELEFAIPFSSIQFQRKSKDEVQTWGFAIHRSYPRDQTYWMCFYPENRNESCMLCQFPKLTGFKGVKPGKNIELDPTFVAIRTDHRENLTAAKLQKKDSQRDLGITGHWSFTPNLTLTAAVNPDFSQVEADAAQLDINTQFALYYPEKRPLFLEGVDFFRTPLNAVYTRTIADPDWGIKLSGKEGKNTIGFFTSHDRVTNLVLPGSQSSDTTTIARDTFSSVLRYRRDFGSSSTVGLLVTDREGDGYYNRVAGVDALIRLTKSDAVLLQFLGSKTLYPEDISRDYGQPEDSFTGSALSLSYQKKKKSYYWKLEYNNFTPGFRADLGFIPQVDFRRFDVSGGYIYWGKPKHFLQIIEVRGNLFQVDDHKSNLIDRAATLGLDLSGPLQSNFSWEITKKRKVFNEIPFDQYLNHVNFSLNPSRSLNFNISLAAGDEIDYDNIRPGKMIFLNPSLSYRLGKSLYLTINYSLKRLKVEGERLFLAKILETHLNYYFSKRAYLRGILQYVIIDRNPDLYVDQVDEKEKTLFSQILFSYKLNPRTVLFIGYSDDYLGNIYVPLTQTNRTFFIKFGYALSM